MSLLQDRIREILDCLIVRGRELGVQVAAYRDGELIVDAWAGTADPRDGEPVTAQTLFPVFSVTKGIATTVIHRLVERGLLDYGTPLAALWPEFAAHGKEGVTLEHALRHTAGLWETPPELTFARMLDWDAACTVLAAAPPLSPPGERFVYHAKTFGWLIGEPARRADGRSFSRMVADEIAAPLGLKTLFVGLPAPENHPVAFLVEKGSPDLRTPPPEELAGQPAVKVPLTHQMNTPAMQAACLPSTNGMMNARALARHYAALLPGGVDGVELLPASRLAAATQWETREGITRGLGYERWDIVLPSGGIEGFGHGGYGGSMGFAFPKLGLAVGYTRNLFGEESGWSRVIDALVSHHSR